MPYLICSEINGEIATLFGRDSYMIGAHLYSDTDRSLLKFDKQIDAEYWLDNNIDRHRKRMEEWARHNPTFRIARVAEAKRKAAAFRKHQKERLEELNRKRREERERANAES